MNILSVRLSIFWGIWSAVLLASGFLAYRNVQKFSEATGWVDHSRQVIETAQATLTTLTEAETAERGYLITGSPVSLEPYQAALATIQEENGRLQALVRADPRQSVRVHRMAGLITDKLAELRETVALRNRDPEGARLAVMAHQAVNLMVPIRDEVEALRNEELGLLAERQGVGRQARRAALGSGISSGILGLVGMAGLLLLVAQANRQRNRHERDLAQSELRFRKLTELSPNAIWVNRNDRIELANTESLRLMGATRADQIEGKSPFQIFHSSCHAQVQGRLEAARDGQVVHLSEETVVRLDGSLRQVEVSSAPFEDSNGPAVQVVLRDVTEHQQAERALRDSEERFRRLFETAPVPYALFTKSGLTMALNQRFQETFGYDLADIPDMLTWWRRAYPETATLREIEHYWEDIATRSAESGPSVVLGGRREIACKDGTVRTVEVSGLLQQDQVLATFFDLTEHLRAEADRRVVEERMGQAQRLEALGVLVAGVAHNFNNILAIIMGTASMQEHLAKDSAQMEALRIIDTACQRGRGLVRSLTHFARPSVPNLVPIDLGALVAELRLLLGNTARKNIALVEDLAEEPAWILGDPGSFNSALMNLCLNSLDAMPHGGTLILRTTIQPGDMVEISVEDTGEGMTPEILARVTEPFFTTKAVDKGTGLGLSIAHGVIKAHGGTLEIASTPGQGTQVKVRIPRHLVQAGDLPILRPQRALGLAKVLVVDDEDEVRTMLARMLTLAGAGQVKAVASGIEALKCLDSGDIPDLILLDHNMPGLDGAQTLALIRSDHQNIPIIISTGELDLDGRNGFNQDKVVAISKPFTLDEFRMKLAELRIGAA